jgi:hypothetical protein
MGRPRKRRLFPVAVTIAEAVDVLGCRPRTIRSALQDGRLVARKTPDDNRKLILVCDLVDFVKTWPLTEIRSRIP